MDKNTTENNILKISTTEKYILKTCVILLVCIAFILNGIVIILYIRYLNVRKMSGFFTLALSISDLTVAVFYLIFGNLNNKYKQKSKFLCVHTILFPALNLIISHYLLLAIFIERLIFIRSPFKYINYKNKRITIIIFFSILFFGIIVGLFPLYIVPMGVNNSLLCFGIVNYDINYFYIYYLLGILPTVGGSLFLHIWILKIANYHAKNMQNQMDKVPNISKSSKLTLIKLLIMVLLWTFYGIILKITMETLSPIFLQLSETIILFQTVINPSIILYGNSTIKNHFFKMFARKKINATNDLISTITR